MQPGKHRVQSHRAKLRAAGFRPIQIWVPDTSAPGFAVECQRQSSLAQADPTNLEDLAAFSDIADWGEEE